MGGYSCKFLNEQITFYPDNISTCCSGFASPRLYELEDGKNIDFDRLTKTKYGIVEDFKNGQINNSILKEYLKLSCEECPHLCEYDEKAEYKQFKRILINHFTGCNCACTYCVRDTYLTQEEKQSKPKYELLPIIEEMYRKNLISKEHLEIVFQGGDIGCLQEFKDLVRVFHQNSNAYFLISTNNIIYHPILEKLFSENRLHMSVAIDSGTREMFRKIKRVDKFDNVIKNIKKYFKNSKTAPDIVLKYIIVNKVNDNLKEFVKFIDIVQNTGVKSVVISIDFNNIMNLLPKEDKYFEIPKYYYDLINSFFEEAQKRDIHICIDDYSKSIYEKGFFGNRPNI